MLFRSYIQTPRGKDATARGFSPAAGRASSAKRIQNIKGSRSEERRVGKGVDLGGRRIIKKKNKKLNNLIKDFKKTEQQQQKL